MVLRRTIIIGLIVVVAIAMTGCMRSNKRMEKLAEREIVLWIHPKKMDILTGPIIANTSDSCIKYIWYKELPFNDTAKFFVEVPTIWNPFSKHYVRSTANYQVGYLEGPMSSIGELDSESSFFDLDQNAIKSLIAPRPSDSIKNHFSKERYLYDLNNGFFEILRSDSISITVSFYCTIAELRILSDFIPTSSAIVSISEKGILRIDPVSESVARSSELD